MKKVLLLITAMTTLLTLTGCVVRGPGVWVDPQGYYAPAVVVETAPVVVYEHRHYYQDKRSHKRHKKHKRHYHRHY